MRREMGGESLSTMALRKQSQDGGREGNHAGNRLS